MAGINSRLKLDACPISRSSALRFQVIVTTFEAVKDHLPWIRAVQGGDPGTSLVLDLAGEPAAPSAGAGELAERKAS